MCTLVFTMDGSMNIIALPSIASEFHTSPAGAVWVAVVLQFMILGLALPVGSLSAGFGRRRLFAIGLGYSSSGWRSLTSRRTCPR